MRSTHVAAEQIAALPVRDALEPTITLEKWMVDRRSLKPDPELVLQVATRLARRNDTAVPGYVYIPDTKALLHSRDRTWQFQENLMIGVLDHFLEHAPHLLRHQSSRALCEHLPSRPTDRVGVQSTSFSIIGSRTSDFHQDIFGILYASLNYGTFRNVHGGGFQVFDALKYARDLGHDTVHPLLKKYSMPDIAKSWGFSTMSGATWGPLLPHGEQLEYVTQLADFSPCRYPMVIFSNRIEDGLLHRGMRSWKKDFGKPAARNLQASHITRHQPDFD